MTTHVTLSPSSVSSVSRIEQVGHPSLQDRRDYLDPELSRLGRPRLGHSGLGRRIVGTFFLSMAGVHVGIVAADPQFYGPFADASAVPFVREAWAEVFMAHPAFWGLMVALAETLLGLALLAGRRWAKLGWAGVITFHVLLVLVAGWGILTWCVPALAVLVVLARRDWPHLDGR